MRELLSVGQQSAAVIVPEIALQRSREGPNVTEQGRTIHDLDTSDNFAGAPRGSIVRGGHGEVGLGLTFRRSDGANR